MAFWLAILVAAVFAWLAVKMGFYETWALVFNIVISIYLAIFLRSAIVDIVPTAGDTAYSNALTILATAIAVFLILRGISYTFLTGQFNVPFPKILDVLGAGFLGFVAGLLVAGFVNLLISIMPISENTFVKGIGFATQFEQTDKPVICWWGNLINSVVAHKDNKLTCEQAINELLKNAKSKAKHEHPEPAKPTEPNEAKTDITEEELPGPPPEPNTPEPNTPEPNTPEPNVKDF